MKGTRKISIFKMNIARLRTAFELVRYSANTLDIEPLTVIETNLYILKNDMQFREMYLWGTIYGSVKDYHIAFGYQDDIVSGQIYFYTHNFLEWFEVPRASMKAKEITPYCTTLFQGDPELIINPLKVLSVCNQYIISLIIIILIFRVMIFIITIWRLRKPKKIIVKN